MSKDIQNQSFNPSYISSWLCKRCSRKYPLASLHLVGVGSTHNMDVNQRTEDHEVNKKKKVPHWFQKTRLWCYEKVLLLQLLTMMSLEPIISKLLWLTPYTIVCSYSNVTTFAFGNFMIISCHFFTNYMNIFHET